MWPEIEEEIMLYQIHHQSKADGTTEMIAQSDDIDDNKEAEQKFRGWSLDIGTRHPLPEGSQWLVCNEKSEHFVMMATITRKE